MKTDLMDAYKAEKRIEEEMAMTHDKEEVFRLQANYRCMITYLREGIIDDVFYDGNYDQIDAVRYKLRSARTVRSIIESINAMLSQKEVKRQGQYVALTDQTLELLRAVVA